MLCNSERRHHLKQVKLRRKYKLASLLEVDTKNNRFHRLKQRHLLKNSEQSWVWLPVLLCNIHFITPIFLIKLPKFR